MSYVNIITVDTDGSITDTLVTSAFTTSGSNRHIDVIIGASTSSTMTPVSVSRGSETYVHQRTDENPTGSSWAKGSFYSSSTEPQTGSAAMTVVNESLQHWGFSATVLDDVDQTTRFRDLGGGTLVALNPDGDGAIDALAISSAVGDLVVSAIMTSGTTIPTAPVDADVTQTLRGSWTTGSGQAAGLVATAPGATTATLGWNNTQFRFVHYVASHPPPSYTEPTATIDTPVDSGEDVDVQINEGDSVLLTSSVSDGEEPFEHSWELDIDGGGFVEFSTVADPGSTQFLTAGTNTIRYTVTDNQLNSDSDERTIEVLALEGDGGGSAGIGAGGGGGGSADMLDAYVQIG